MSSNALSESLPFGNLPLLLQCADSAVDAFQWLQCEQHALEEKCAHYGALLFRGFHIDSAEKLERVATMFSPTLVSDNGEHEPVRAGSNIATPVFYAPEKKLLWHNENSFNHRWPRLLWFASVRPADTGGETPLVDSRRVFEAIDPEVRAAFCDKHLMYVRNYGSGLGLNWQHVFQTSDPAELARKCDRDRIAMRWKGDGTLETRAVRPAVVRTMSGDVSWFNQAQHWHPACLNRNTRASLLRLVAEDDLPRQCRYGDGSPISDEAMEHVVEVYRRWEVVFSWQPGDVLMLDNSAVAHARNPYSGERHHLVALGRLTSFEEPSAIVRQPFSLPRSLTTAGEACRTFRNR